MLAQLLPLVTATAVNDAHNVCAALDRAAQEPALATDPEFIALRQRKHERCERLERMRAGTG